MVTHKNIPAKQRSPHGLLCCYASFSLLKLMYGIANLLQLVFSDHLPLVIRLRF
jgi:hypothetical protein